MKLSINIEFNETEVEQYRALSARLAEVLGAPEEETVTPEPELKVVGEHQPVREFNPVVIPPSKNQHLHLTVAKVLKNRTRPVSSGIIAVAANCDVQSAANSLVYLKTSLGLADNGHKHGRKWVATAKLRSRGVVAG